MTSTMVPIVFVNHTAQLGGGELALVNLLACIDRSRFTPSVLLFADGPLRPLCEAYAPVTICPLPLSLLNTRKDSLSFGLLIRLKDLGATAVFIFRLGPALRASGAKLVHTNSLKADILAGIAARLNRIPVVWHVRDRIAEDYLPAVAVTMFRYLARIIPKYVIANSAATLSTLFGNNEALRAHTRSNRSFRHRCCVVHDGIPKADRSAVPAPSREHPVVGIVGRISPWKGQDVFLRAAAAVRERFPTTVFRVIGSPLFGETAYHNHLLELCRDLDLAGHVEFTGFIADVSPVIDDLDILVHASTLPEPFGQVIIEGMAAAKPVVATSGGGVLEIVVDGVTGILVPINDDQAMASAILRLLQDPGLRHAMGTNGKKRVEECFRIEATADRVQSVFDTVLSHDQKKARPG